MNLSMILGSISMPSFMSFVRIFGFLKLPLLALYFNSVLNREDPVLLVLGYYSVGNIRENKTKTNIFSRFLFNYFHLLIKALELRIGDSSLMRSSDIFLMSYRSFLLLNIFVFLKLQRLYGFCIYFSFFR